MTKLLLFLLLHSLNVGIQGDMWPCGRGALWAETIRGGTDSECNKFFDKGLGYMSLCPIYRLLVSDAKLFISLTLSQDLGERLTWLSSKRALIQVIPHIAQEKLLFYSSQYAIVSWNYPCVTTMVIDMYIHTSSFLQIQHFYCGKNTLHKIYHLNHF